MLCYRVWLLTRAKANKLLYRRRQWNFNLLKNSL